MGEILLDAEPKPKVYLETSVVGYYASPPSRNIVTAARQELTRDWWAESLPHFDTYISALVLREVSEGHESAVEGRRQAISGIKVLEINENAETLAETLMTSGAIPQEHPEDALHIALATVHGMDFLVTWNFAHINNAVMKRRIEDVCESKDYGCPVICSPEELGGQS